MQYVDAMSFDRSVAILTGNMVWQPQMLSSFVRCASLGLAGADVLTVSAAWVLVGALPRSLFSQKGSKRHGTLLGMAGLGGSEK